MRVFVSDLTSLFEEKRDGCGHLLLPEMRGDEEESVVIGESHSHSHSHRYGYGYGYG